MKQQDRILDWKSQECSNSIETSFLNHEFFQISNDSITSKEDSIKGSLPQKSRQRESQETRCSEFETAFGKNYICGLKSSTIIESINSFEEILYSKINAFQKNKSASVTGLLKSRKGSKFLQSLLNQLPLECFNILYLEVILLYLYLD